MYKNNFSTAGDLLKEKLPEMNWFINEILPAGVTILAARPKMGKSFLCLNLALKIIEGKNIWDTYNSKKSNVLYFSFEDSKRRMQNRISSQLNEAPLEKTESINRLIIDFTSIELIEDGFRTLKDKIDRSNAKVVIIDTLVGLKDYPESSKLSYKIDHAYFSAIGQFAHKEGIAIILVHHTRKMPADWDIDKVLGTRGATGAADTIWLLDGINGESTLHVIGKDVEDRYINLIFDKNNFIWGLNPNCRGLIYSTPERMEIINLLHKENRAMKTSEIAECLNKKLSAVSSLLGKMQLEGTITNTSYGCYELTAQSSVSSETDEFYYEEEKQI